MISCLNIAQLIGKLALYRLAIQLRRRLAPNHQASEFAAATNPGSARAQLSRSVASAAQGTAEPKKVNHRLQPFLCPSTASMSC
jgi:hypothetical protein